MFNLEEFLLLREKRVEIQNSILEKYKKPMIVLRANYPGEDKNHFIPTQITKAMAKEISEVFNSKIIYSESFTTMEGSTYIFVVNIDGKELKRLAMEIEDTHTLGRTVDIDVFEGDGYPYSRTDFNGQKRQCLICEEMAFVCSRLKKHTQKEVQDKIREKYEDFLDILEKREKLSDSLSFLGTKSVVLEVSSSPSFGLVSPFTNGGHKDMNFFTFLDSSFAIAPYFKEVAKAGYSPLNLDLIFRKIRYFGMIAEKEMFIATKDINTHKGMIFLMGIAIACSAKAIYDNKKFAEIQNYISYMCRDILNDFNNLDSKTTLTHGEKLFLEHGIVGVRGIVKNGLDSIFNSSINIFEDTLNKTSNINTAMVKTIIDIMSSIEDTTILHRHDVEVLNQVKEKALELKNIFSEKEIDLDLLKEIEKDYSNNRISPGGAADLLAVTIFLSNSKKFFI